MKNKQDMIKQLFLSSLMTMIMSATVSLLGMIIDGVIISRFLGRDAMSAYGIVSPLFVLLSAVSGVLSSGTQTVCAKALGKGDEKKAHSSFSTNFVFAFLISIVLILVIAIFAKPIASGLGASGSAEYLMGDVTAYMYGLMFSIPFMCMSTTLNSVMFIEGNRKLAVTSTYAMCAVNVTGDLLCAFVFHGGMFGMAFATTLSYIVSVVVLLSHFRHDHILKFSLKSVDFKTVPDIITVGLPTAVNRACNMLRSVVLNRLLVAISTSVAVSAFSVRTNLNNLYSSVSVGMGMSMLVIGSVFAGEEDEHNLSHLLKIGLKYGFCITSIICAAVCVFAKPLVAIYTNDSEVATLAVPALILYAISVPLYTVIIVFMNYYQATGHKVFTNIITFLDNFLIVTIVGIGLGNVFGVYGVWVAFPIAEVIMLIALYIMVWIMVGHMPRNLKDLMLLPADFDTSEKDRYRTSCTDLDSVINSSKEINEFLILQGVSDSNANRMSLCVEELGSNVIKWGFSDNKPHSIDIYLFFKNGVWTLRMRDDCESFNPKKWYELNMHEKSTDNLGIRMVFAQNPDISYSGALKLNTVSLEMQQI